MSIIGNGNGLYGISNKLFIFNSFIVCVVKFILICSFERELFCMYHVTHSLCLFSYCFFLYIYFHFTNVSKTYWNNKVVHSIRRNLSLCCCCLLLSMDRNNHIFSIWKCISKHYTRTVPNAQKGNLSVRIIQVECTWRFQVAEILICEMYSSKRFTFSLNRNKNKKKE